MRRAIQRELETPLSKRLLGGDVKAGQTVVAGYNAEEGVTFSVEEPAEVEVEVAAVGVEA